MRLINVYVDGGCRKEKVEGGPIAQNSSDAVLRLLSDTEYASVRVTFRSPTGAVSYALHMVGKGYDSDSRKYVYEMDIPYSITSFTMPSQSATLYASFHCWGFDDTSRGGEAVCDVGIRVERSGNSEVVDPGYGGDDVENLWKTIGGISAEINNGQLLIHVLPSMPADLSRYEDGALLAVRTSTNAVLYRVDNGEAIEIISLSGIKGDVVALGDRVGKVEASAEALEETTESLGSEIDGIKASAVSYRKKSTDGLVLADGVKTASESDYSPLYAKQAERDSQGRNLVDTYATKQEVADSISSLEKRTFQIVDELPPVGEEGVIYLTAVSDDPDDGYNQHIYEGGQYIDLGTTKLDLSAYATIDLVNLKTKKFIFGPAPLKDVIIAAYEDEGFRDALGFADTTDVGEDGKALYGKSVIVTEELTRDAEGGVIGAEYSVVANGELYHAVLLENGGGYTVAISNPYVKKDDAVLAKALESISGVQQGIVGQYLKQTPAVLAGSDYAINLKLRESRNYLDLEDIPETTTDGITYSVANGTLKISGTPTSGGTVQFRIATLSTPLPAGNVTLSCTIKNKADIAGRKNYFMMVLRTPTDNFVTNIGNDGISYPAGTRVESTRATTKETGIVYYACLDGYTYDQEISDIQIEKGSTAHPYDEYGTYSKGSVVQYAGKNVLNLPGTSEMETKAAMYGNTPVTISKFYSNFFIYLNNGGTISSAGPSESNAQYHKFIEGHKYFLALGKGDSDGVWSDVGSPLNITLMEQGSTVILSGVQAPYQSPDGKWALNATKCVYENAKPAFIFLNGNDVTPNSFPISAAVVIDLTAAGDGYLTTEEAYEKYSPYLDTLASGASIANNKRTSPLIKNFGTGLYLTKPEGYSLVISEFSDMPPALNQSVDFDSLTFLAQTKYPSSGKVTLQPTTQSIIYMVEKDGDGSISDGDLTSWQSSSQLEYGDYATEITAYVAPKMLGTFDYLEGDAKSIITKVGEGDNVHVGFIPDEGYLGIDYANSTDDLSQSYVAYRTIDLATQVANNVEQIANLETRVAELEALVKAQAEALADKGDAAE